MNQYSKPAFSPTKVDKLTFFKDHIIVSEMHFDERVTSGGIIILDDDKKSSGIRPRWGRVYAVGPEQTDVRVGEWVCVAHGRWTRGIDIEDGDVKRTIRKIDPKDILISADERPNDLTFSEAIHVEKKTR